MKYRIIKAGPLAISIIVIIDGKPKVVNRNNSNFEALLRELKKDTVDLEKIRQLLSVRGIVEKVLTELVSVTDHPEKHKAEEDRPLTFSSKAATHEKGGSEKKVFTGSKELTPKVEIIKGNLYCGGEKVDDKLSKLILQYVTEGNDDYVPLARLLQRIQANPNEEARDGLFDFLLANKYWIDSEGFFYGYRWIAADGKSHHEGKEMCRVNGRFATGRIPNPVGATISMDRKLVDSDPSRDCSVGLHVGSPTYNWSGPTRGNCIVVKVDPVDVGAVPRGYAAKKMRVCRFKVVAKHADFDSTGLVKL